MGLFLAVLLAGPPTAGAAAGQWPGRPQVRDSGQAARDPQVRRFVRGLHIGGQPGIRDEAWLPRAGLLFFTVSLGWSGDSYRSYLFVRHRGRVSAVRSVDQAYGALDSAVAHARYRLSPTEMTLARPRVLDAIQALKGRHIRDLYTPVMEMLLADSLAPASVPLRCRATPYNATPCATDVVLRAAVRTGQVGLLAQLAVRAEAWQQSPSGAYAAREALRPFAPAVLARPDADPIVLLALAEATLRFPPDSLLAGRLLGHERAGRDLAVLTTLAELYPLARAALRRRLHTDPLTTAILTATVDPMQRVDCDLLLALLDSPRTGHDPEVLAVLANATWQVCPAAGQEASRRLPAEALRRWEYRTSPPALQE